ncbi:MAG: antitoxin family protein [Armatimonadota bacterium]|nr:antitoxin family protein [Armatimonadota bacterium]
MDEPIEAIYEAGVFKPLEPVTLPEGQKVALTVEPVRLTPSEARAQLREWNKVYDGLTEQDVTDIESMALDRSHFSPPMLNRS